MHPFFATIIIAAFVGLSQQVEPPHIGSCLTDYDCYPKLRTQAPASSKLCTCYAATVTRPIDECEGQEHCAVAKCDMATAESCSGYQAVCVVTGYINPETGYSKIWDLCTQN